MYCIADCKDSSLERCEWSTPWRHNIHLTKQDRIWTHCNSASDDNINSCAEEAIEDTATDNRDPKAAMKWLNIHLNSVQNNDKAMK